jgi:HD-GYP domain-containing protein (c-di-GMP phosphodiesterase class II)
MHEPHDDPDVERLLQVGRARRRVRAAGREALTEAAAAGSFLACAVALPLLASSARPLAVVPCLVAVLAYAAAGRVQFEVSDGHTSPTQLVFVPMLFVLPLPLVPLLAAAGELVGRLVDVARGRASLRRVWHVFGDSWYAVGPTVVLLAAGAEAFSWDRWPVYIGAFGAQVLVDAAASCLRDWLADGTSPRVQLRLLSWVYIVDAFLSPVALAFVAADPDDSWPLVLGLPLAGLFAFFAADHRRGIDRALELSRAYRGTALLLGDVVEADHAYTGSHSRDVVDLSLAVSDRLGLDAPTRRRVEFGALLHDVGKIRVPKAVLDKAGPLDDAEWKVMRRHTIEGEEMLERVGGVLAEVGRVVRASHERYDGRGYPDGLTGEEIPIEARIVCACDAFSAMTSARSYRSARSVEAALAELDACAGSQFDPDVVRAARAVVGERHAARPAAFGRSGEELPGADRLAAAT